MKKTGKKRKLSLKRRIRKTTASLFMALAIVVAMLPVENMKTTQASLRSTVETDLDEYYNGTSTWGTIGNRTSTDTTASASANYNGETFYTGDDVTLQRIEGSYFLDVFSAKLDSSKKSAMITNYESTQLSEMEIYEKEHFDYVEIDNTYVEAVKTAFENEKYTITFHDGVTTGYGDTSKGLTEFDMVQLNVSSYEYSIGDQSSSGSLSGTYANKYTDFLTITPATYVKNMFEGANAVDTSVLSQAKTNAQNYNNSLSGYTTRLKAIANKQNPEQSDKDEWNRIKSEIDTAYQAAKTSYKKLADVSTNVNNDDLPDILNYTICNRMCLSGASSFTLMDFTLQELWTENSNYVFVPKLKSSKTNSSQYTDNNGYLAGGEVTIGGIAHEAFSKAKSSPVGSLTSVVIPNTVVFIGTGAFENQELQSVTIKDEKCKEIGDKAFSGCTKLTDVTFASSASAIEKIGNEAFKNTGSIKSVTIPRNVKELGRACFANSKVAEVTFANGGTADIEIYPFAFYDCSDLVKVTFTKDRAFVIDQAAFACGAGANDNMTSFIFPAKMKNNAIIQNASADEKNYDFILAGRENLKDVTLPENLGRTNKAGLNKIPDYLLAGCTNLNTLTFPESSYAGTYEEDLLNDVMNPQFYVIGPKYASGNKNIDATSRTTTWDIAIDQDGDNTKEYNVPYQYTENGVKYIEIGKKDANGNGSIIESIQVNSDNTTATLTGYTLKDAPQDKIAINIPEKVGQYTITAIAPGCIGETLKPWIYKVTIADGTVKTIGAEAFEGCPALQWVEIGNSVTSIETKAFANCKELENVVFSQNMITDWSTLKIAADAFSTQSDFLTFHGAIHSDYAPYVIASNKGSSTQALTGTGNEICYVTDAPLHLTVIKDRSTGDNSGKMTLVDYPHYEDIDADNYKYINDLKGNEPKYSIIERFEYFNGIVTSAPASYIADGDLKTGEKNIVEQVLHMYLPDGIESIDSKTFFEASRENTNSFEYFNKIYQDTGTEIKSLSREYRNGTNDYERRLNSAIDAKFHAIEKVYSSITKGVDPEEEVVPGLYSGYFYGNLPNLSLLSPEGTKTYDGHTYVEKESRGNDHLTSINLETVTSLPDYAFDSNENLITVSFGDSMQNIGALPFRGCKSLNAINTNGNTKYVYDNWILYEVLENGSYKIIECLEGRATNINQTNDPNIAKVSELAEACFSNCAELTDIDLSSAKFINVPSETFYGCNKLTSLKLPASVQTIKDRAFSKIEGTGSVTISIPNLNCTLNKGMCDDSTKKFNIQGIQYRDEINGVYSSCYDSFMDLQKAYGKDSNGNYKAEWFDYDQTFTVTFKLLDNTVIDEPQMVSKGKAATPPTPPDIDGKKFVSWYSEVNGALYNGDSAYTNITEDRTVFAVYTDDKSVVVSDGSEYTLTMAAGQASLASDLTTYVTSLKAKGGTSIAIMYSGTGFTTWSAKGTANGKDYSSLINPITATTALFTMPNDNVTIGMNTVTSSGSGSGSNGSGSNGSGNGSGSNGSGNGSSTDTTAKYTLTVNYGSGSGDYAAGEIVSISANAPDSSTRVFSKWTSSTSGVGFADASKATTTITMPASSVVVTANYKTRTDDEEDDNVAETPNRRPGSSSGSSTTTGTNTGSNNTATGNTTTNNNGGNGAAGTNAANGSGDELYISKNGISNKDVGTANVGGSTDNFVVKISDTEDAAELAKQALLNKYGTLDGIAYFPMDISLYDASGNHQITDTYGLNVTVTMPIPDALIQYGGNAHVAAVENGYLNELAPRFTTIDGIGCISFVPPHFSPYVIYVDTNNLVAGQTFDSTPQTGDPIHPKWFLATGMACLSIFLFVSGDRKKKIRLA